LSTAAINSTQEDSVMTPTTWPADRPVLEAAACQLGRCQHCGAYTMTFAAADGATFALAHLGDDAAAIKQWLAESLGAAQ
jgi:hypothetical protein